MLRLSRASSMRFRGLAVSSNPPTEVTIGHITVKEKPGDRIDASCSKCGQGIDIGARFGIIPGDVLLAQWIKQHAHKPKAAKRASRVL